MRVAAWQAELDKEFRESQRRRFRWGYHDCCQFAARCVRAITGVDRRDLFVTYRTKAEALSLLECVGGMRVLITRALGEEKPVAFATHGDIVLIDMGAGEQPAVCMGVFSFAPGCGRSGLRKCETAKAVAAWAV